MMFPMDLDEYGLPRTTDFADNAIGLDPYGCGCMDCLIGASIPFDQTQRVGALARAAAAGDRTVVNRTDYPLVLAKDAYGEARFVELSSTSEVVAVYPTD